MKRPPASSVPDPRMRRSRAAIIAATLDLLVERGIAGTTIEAVAQRSGAAKTTIYRQWDDQPSLVLDAIASTLRDPTDPDTDTLRGDLEALLAGLAGALRTSPAARLMPALIDAAERDPRFAALHRRAATRRHAVIRAVITRAITRGELPPHTDPDEVLDLLAGPLFYRRWVSGGPVGPDFTARHVDRVVAAFRQS